MDCWCGLLTSATWTQVARHASAESPLLGELPIDRRVAVIGLEHAWRRRAEVLGDAAGPFMPAEPTDFRGAADDVGTGRNGSPPDYSSALLMRMKQSAALPPSLSALHIHS